MRKWKCVETNKSERWPIGEIYETDDDGWGLCSDDKRDITWVQPWNFTGTGIRFEEIKEFTKSDLVNGKHAVRYRNGDFDVYENSDLRKTFLHLYDENLIRIDKCTRLDIIEVFELNPIWKREEKSEKDLKIEQLENQARDLADKIAELKGE